MTEPISDETLSDWLDYYGTTGPASVAVPALVGEVRRLGAVIADKDREIAGLARICNSWESDYDEAKRHAASLAAAINNYWEMDTEEPLLIALAEYEKWANLGGNGL